VIRTFHVNMGQDNGICHFTWVVEMSEIPSDKILAGHGMVSEDFLEDMGMEGLIRLILPSVTRCVDEKLEEINRKDDCSPEEDEV
jgi:hypothetical protein